MTRKLLFSAFAALTLAFIGLGFGARTASAEVVVNDWFPFTLVVDNPCEAGINPITFTGEYQALWYTTPDGTLMMHIHVHYAGTDASGTAYVLNNQRTMEHWAWPSIAPYSDQIVMRLTSKGDGPNAVIEITVEYSTTYPPTPPAVTSVTCHG